MNKILKYIYLTLFFGLFESSFCHASGMEETMYSEGKIYVGVAVMSVIFAGIAIYLIMLDRKISVIERKLNRTKDNLLKD